MPLVLRFTVPDPPAQGKPQDQDDQKQDAVEQNCDE